MRKKTNVGTKSCVVKASHCHDIQQTMNAWGRGSADILPKDEIHLEADAASWYHSGPRGCPNSESGPDE